MSIVKNDNHVAEALANRIEQFKDKPNFADVLTTYVTQVQEIEDALNQLLTETNLTDSEGQQLDNIGELIGEGRFGRLDTPYLDAINARRKLNLATGTRETILGLIEAIEPGTAVTITEFFPAGFVAAATAAVTLSAFDAQKIASFIRSGRSVGVGSSLHVYESPPFQYDAGSGYDVGKYSATYY